MHVLAIISSFNITSHNKYSAGNFFFLVKQHKYWKLVSRGRSIKYMLKCTILCSWQEDSWFYFPSSDCRFLVLTIHIVFQWYTSGDHHSMVRCNRTSTKIWEQIFILTPKMNLTAPQISCSATHINKGSATHKIQSPFQLKIKFTKLQHFPKNSIIKLYKSLSF